VTNKGLVHSAAVAKGSAGHPIGGAGKTGVDLHAGGSVVNFITIAGGQGGAGANTASHAYKGGQGSVGVVLGGSGSISNSLLIAGGAGGAGAEGYGSAGADGGGANGIDLLATGTPSNLGAIRGRHRRKQRPR
jgi:hypothetical protein